MKYTYETIQQYEIQAWNYEPVERTAVFNPQAPDIKPRFIKDGSVWRNPAARDTGKATLILAGDLMCQERFIKAYQKEGGEDYDFNPTLKYVKKVLKSADLAVGNLEGAIHERAPYSNEQLFIGRFPNRNFPPHYAAALAANGFDLLTTANNHILDTGLSGLYRTCECLDALGFIHTGSFTDPDEPHYVLVDVNGIKVGVVSYTMFYNFRAGEYVANEGIDKLLNIYSKNRAERDIAALRAAGADFIICYMHWGKEMVHTLTERQTAVAGELANAGVDYIAAAHPHVVQPYDIIRAEDGRRVPVAYSMGNLTNHFEKAAPRTSILLRLELSRNDDGSISVCDSYLPCYSFLNFDKTKYAVVPLTNKRYVFDKTNQIVAERKSDTVTIVGSKIKLCTEYDTP